MNMVTPTIIIIACGHTYYPVTVHDKLMAMTEEFSHPLSPLPNSSALEKLDQRLECSVCQHRLTNPRTLSCLHSFCKECLEKQPVLEQEETRKRSLECPTCRLPAVLPDGGVQYLSTASHIASLFRLHEKLEAISRSRDTISCPTHDKPLDVYCESCEQLACVKCTLRAHRDHSCSIVDDIFERHKRRIQSTLVPLKEKVDWIDEAVKNFDAQSTKISEQGYTVKQEVHATIQQLIKTLQETETRLSETVDTAVQQKLQQVSWQRGEADAVLVQLRSCQEFVEEELQLGSQQHIVEVEKELVTEMQAITSVANTKSLSPLEETNITFKKDEAAITSSSKVGKVEYSCNYLAQRCTATGKALKNSMVAFQTSFELSFKTEDGVALSFSQSLISCQLSYHYYNFIKKCPCYVTELQPGRYKVTYTPVSRGAHELKVCLGGVNLPNSPFKVHVFPHPEMREKPIKLVGDLNGPYAVGLTKSGSIVVTEWDRHCISVLSSEGEKFATYGKKGLEQLQFNCPAGITISRDNFIYVADVYNHRIQKLSVRGTFVTAVGCYGNGKLQFNRPSWVAIHPETQEVFVSDTLNHRIQVINPNLTFSRSFGQRGTNPGQFQHPAGIAFNSKGMMYVVDGTNHRIQKFTPDGELIAEFGQSHLQLPSGICIDDCDVLYIADARAHKVVSFASDGTVLGSFGSEGKKPGLFDQPHGVVVDYTGNLYVSDSRLGRVVIC